MMTLLFATIIRLFTAVHPVGSYLIGTQSVRSARTFNMTDRYPNQWVSDIFKDNILLTLAYMDDKVVNPKSVNWTTVDKPQTYSFTLKPGQVFAFHNDVLPQFAGKVAVTTNATFMWDQSFKSDGYLTGDGVCHLASLMYWAAKDAGLSALAPTNHDFANIPEVPKQYGVAIYAGNPEQNLYITNTFTKPVQFAFAYDGTKLTVKVID